MTKLPVSKQQQPIHSLLSCPNGKVLVLRRFPGDLGFPSALSPVCYAIPPALCPCSCRKLILNVSGHFQSNCSHGPHLQQLMLSPKMTPICLQRGRSQGPSRCRHIVLGSTADIPECHPFSPFWPHFSVACEFQMFESRGEQALPAGQGGDPARLREMSVFSLEKIKRGFYQYPEVSEGRCQGMEQFLLSC